MLKLSQLVVTYFKVLIVQTAHLFIRKNDSFGDLIAVLDGFEVLKHMTLFLGGNTFHCCENFHAKVKIDFNVCFDRNL